MKIERNVPLPERIAKRFRIGSLPLDSLVVGDSFFIEINESVEEMKRILHSLRVRLGRFSQKNPKVKFSATVMEKEGGIRVWRVR